jgi:pyruvate-formate lyase-activating enzyme
MSEVVAEPLYHVTALSNFARAFDKYARRYCKSRISQSTYPNEFYLLPAHQLAVGVAKARRLIEKLGIPRDEPLVMRAAVSPADVLPNLRNGIGVVWPSPDLPIAGTFAVTSDGAVGAAATLEDVMARSLDLHKHSFLSYAALRARTLSFLPIARGCQAACPFCFSEASVSVDQPTTGLTLETVQRWIAFARLQGAERAVITGGGEPTLLKWARLLELVGACKGGFDKVVLITNGVRLATSAWSVMQRQLVELADAGVSVLAVSRHHHSEAVNARLMGIETKTRALLETHAALGADMSMRLICVLQRGGVESVADVHEYMTWASSLGVDEVCFKELYVSTSHQSVYFSRSANTWSERNQVSLSVVHEWAQQVGLGVQDRLPWGAPIFAGEFAGRRVRVAAYTEPSLFWERSHGLARSWNVMADGSCLASLEDRNSAITLPEAEVHE